MESDVREMDGVLVASFGGEVDLESSPGARSVLLDCLKQSMPVLVDLSAVSYIDSSGVASLVEAFQASRQAGVAFALAAPSDAARRVLSLARLDKVFSIHDSLADGLKNVAG